MEQVDEQDQDPLDGHQHTKPTGHQIKTQDGQRDGQNTLPSGKAPGSSAAGQESQSPVERAAAERHPGSAQSEDQFPMPPSRTGTLQAKPSVPATGPSPPVPVTGQQLSEAIRVAMAAQGRVVTEEFCAHLENLSHQRAAAIPNWNPT